MVIKLPRVGIRTLALEHLVVARRESRTGSRGSADRPLFHDTFATLFVGVVIVRAAAMLGARICASAIGTAVAGAGDEGKSVGVVEDVLEDREGLALSGVVSGSVDGEARGTAAAGFGLEFGWAPMISDTDEHR